MIVKFLYHIVLHNGPCTLDKILNCPTLYFDLQTIQQSVLYIILLKKNYATYVIPIHIAPFDFPASNFGGPSKVASFSIAE